MADDRLPTNLWVEACLREWSKQGKYHYIIHKGAHAGGMVLVKINTLDGNCLVLIQQRDLDGKLGWSGVLGDDPLPETKADDYIKRAVFRDPDLWAIEIEDRAGTNPFAEVKTS